MAEVKVFYDREGKTLTVWFTDRSQEYVALETAPAQTSSTQPVRYLDAIV